MGEPQLNLEPVDSESFIITEEKGKTTKEKVDNTLTEELVIGICSPIGSSKEVVIHSLKKQLEDTYKYQSVTIIKLSDFIKGLDVIRADKKEGETPAYTELMNKIEGGNDIRDKHSWACLVEKAIEQIYTDRVGVLSDPKEKGKLKSRRVCYIIDSIKNKEELQVLQRVYRDIFYCFSVFSNKAEREINLRTKGLSADEIKKIIETDDFENNQHGQNVRNTFTEADFFVRVSNTTRNKVDKKIERFLHLIFESSIITPMQDEIAMYEAKSAAGNSACLSRQVGAAITNKKGEVISRGWNDVPKYGGNLYHEGSSVDHRCKLEGECKNETTKHSITQEIIQAITRDPELGKVINSSHEKLLWSILRESSKIKDLIEFSRAVHAEMHAIITGSQLSGNKMINGKLFCTTYPCHNCARHIILAGIKEVYFIEPYVKSLCLKLHSDAITEDEAESNKVKLLMYDGVAPKRYLEFFTMSRERKDKQGIVIKQNLHNIVPKKRISLAALSTLEEQAIHSLAENGAIEEEEV
jgi:deoxycytidylate deaminase